MLEVFCRVSAEVSPHFIENFPTQFDFSGMLEKICEDVGVTVSLVNNNCTLEGQWSTIGRAHNMLVSTLAVYGSSSAIRKEHEDLVSQGSRPFSALVEAAEAISRGVELQEQVQNEMMHMKGMSHIPQLQASEGLQSLAPENPECHPEYTVETLVPESYSHSEPDTHTYKGDSGSFPTLERILTSHGKQKTESEEMVQHCQPEYVQKQEYDDNMDAEWLENTDNEEVDKIQKTVTLTVFKNDETATQSGLKGNDKNRKGATGKKNKKRIRPKLAMNNKPSQSNEQLVEDTDTPMKNTQEVAKKDDTYPCNMCSFVGRTQNNLTGHKSRTHNDTPIKCDICHKIFQNIRYMKRHRSSHNKPLNSCEICGKSYKVMKALKDHLKRHNNNFIQIKYGCPECMKEFCSQYILDSHIKSEHKGIKKTFLCQKCGKSFTTKHTLQQHDNVHSGARPYKCEDCGKAFTYESALRDHRNIHEGMKKFMCSHEGCDKAFRQRSSLKMHEKIHNNERDFKCKQCGRDFTQKQALQRHLRSHKGFKPYSCKHCQKTFGDAAVIRRHIKLVHRIHKDVETWREDVDILAAESDKEDEYVNEVDDINDSEGNKSNEFAEEESSSEFQLTTSHVRSPIRLPPVTAIHNFQLANKIVPDNQEATHLPISEPVNMFSIPSQEYMLNSTAPVVPYSYTISILDTPASMSNNGKSTVMPVNTVVSDPAHLPPVPDTSIMHHLNQLAYPHHIRNHHITEVPVPVPQLKGSHLVPSDHDAMTDKHIPVPYSIDLPIDSNTYSNLLVVNSKHGKALEAQTKLTAHESDKQAEVMEKTLTMPKDEVKTLEAQETATDNLSFSHFYDLSFPPQY